LGLKLAGYDFEENHGLPNADFHETRTFWRALFAVLW
jgi:hypothetical protein